MLSQEYIISTSLNNTLNNTSLNNTSLNKFFPVQYCPKSIKTTLNSIFSKNRKKELFVKCILMVLNLEKCYERFNRKKIINVIIWIWFSFWPSDNLKFFLKCFELILFNGPFMILVIRFTVIPLTSEQNEYAWCLHQPNLIYFLMCSMSKFILN